MALCKDKLQKNRRSVMLPTRFIALGEVFEYGGMTLQCVRREGHRPGEACQWCALKSKFCDTLQCCRSDREDGVSVWFVRVDEDVTPDGAPTPDINNNNNTTSDENQER